MLYRAKSLQKLQFDSITLGRHPVFWRVFLHQWSTSLHQFKCYILCQRTHRNHSQMEKYTAFAGDL